MRIESRHGATTLHLGHRERHEMRVAGQNHVHAIFDAASRRIYTYVDVGASASGPRVRIRMPRRIAGNGLRLPWPELVEVLAAHASSHHWRRGVRVAS